MRCLIITVLLATSCSDRAVDSDAGSDPDALGSDLQPPDARPYTRPIEGPHTPIERRTCQMSRACSTKSDCQAMGYLDCKGGQCIMCREDDDCPNVSLLSWKCNKATNWCQRCISDADCTIGDITVGTGKCGPNVGHCMRCDDDADCTSAGPPHSSRCTTVTTLFGSTRMCVGCTTDDDCRNSPTKGCDPITNTCVRCTTDAECCPLGAPCELTCSISGQCICSTDQQCADAYNPAYRCTP